ncbi:MAG: hypothetical protein LDL33_12665 [Desulfomonile sp.]|nr:hypothetical protein [Desulfomonile sp.]
METHSLLIAIDPYLIWFYRLTGYTFVDFLIGTFVLAFLAVMLGELTTTAGLLVNRRHLEKATEEMVKYQNMSVDAIAASDKAAFRASNKLANDAFGRTFFMQIAVSAAFLWPVFIALTWMGSRFAEVEFRLAFTDFTVGYAAVFVPLYAAAYLCLRRLRHRLPYFGRVRAVLDAFTAQTKRMKRFEDLAKPVQKEIT